jgi:hypothetical protein
MARNHIAIYVWIVDTIERFGHITLSQLNRQWELSPYSDGNPLARRTFFNYRNAIEEIFNINILCNRSTFEYYIDHTESESESRLQHWLLDSMSLSGMLSNSSDVSSRIVLENVPSARKHLPVIIDAMRENHRIAFDYKSHKRVNATQGIVIEPYFVKIFKQLWYVIGYNVKDSKIKTYALDRMSNLTLTPHTFKMPTHFDPIDFFKDCFGITTNQDEAKEVILRVSTTQAKYMRALPLHPSQQEEIHDQYSIFRYKMRLTYDLMEELLSHGSNIEVLSPPELKLQIITQLQAALNNYTQ